jgi:hypothetical protein
VGWWKIRGGPSTYKEISGEKEMKGRSSISQERRVGGKEGGRTLVGEQALEEGEGVGSSSWSIGSWGDGKAKATAQTQTQTKTQTLLDGCARARVERPRVMTRHGEPW